jgi:hypothetical protein
VEKVFVLLSCGWASIHEKESSNPDASIDRVAPHSYNTRLQNANEGGFGLLFLKQ